MREKVGTHEEESGQRFWRVNFVANAIEHMGVAASPFYALRLIELSNLNKQHSIKCSLMGKLSF